MLLSPQTSNRTDEKTLQSIARATGVLIFVEKGSLGDINEINLLPQLQGSLRIIDVKFNCHVTLVQLQVLKNFRLENSCSTMDVK